MRHIIGVLLLFIGYPKAEVYAQSRNTVIVRKFTQKEGLSSYNIRKIIQDKWGFIWVATQDGISRFDGRTFLNYSKNSLPENKICGSEVREIIEDTRQNLIWTLSSEGGVDAINTINAKVERTIRIPNQGKEDYNLSMLKREGELWIGSSTGVQIFDCIKSKFSQNLSLPSNQNRTIDFATRSIQQDEYGNVWVCYGGYGIVIYEGTTKAILKIIRLAELNNQSQAHEVRIPTGIFLKNGEVLFATSQGLRKIYYTKSYQVTVNKFPCIVLNVLNQENIDWIIRDTENSLLVSGYNGLYRLNYSLSQYQAIGEVSRTYESNWLSSVLCMYKDKTGHIWLGCQEGLGKIDKTRSPFKPYSYDFTSTIKLDHVFAVSPIADHSILVGLRNGLVEISNVDGKYVRYDKGHLYQHIFIDSKKIIHVSRPDGLFIYKKGKIVPIYKVYPEFYAYSGYSINSHLVLSDTLTILGTENNKGLLLWNPVRKSVRIIDVTTSPSLASSIVNNIYKDSHGRIWVLSDNVLTILSANLQSSKEVELRENDTGMDYNLFFDMCDTNGSYWIASYGSGILQVDEHFHVKYVFNTRNGLSNDGVYQVYSLPGNELLVTSNNGLTRINLATAKLSCYYLNDGLHSNAFEEVSGLMNNGTIYAGGVNGFTIIDPKRFSANTNPPQLYFTSVEMKTASNETAINNLLMKAITIPTNVIQTTVHFRGLNYSNPERTQYAYRIVEESSTWIENGNQASLPLISHSPGNYTLEVKAVNEEGVWSKPIQLQLYFQPKWYQTWWFRLLMMTLVVGIVYLFYRFRIQQLQHEHHIRERLARDLHDDLGSTMNSINIYTNLAIMENGANRYLTNIKQGAQESLASIRDIIWILDDNKDTVGQLGERICQFANPLCEANKLSFTFFIDPDLKDAVFQKEEKRNLYMIIKEAINNSIKYAESRQVSLSFSLKRKKLFITISDDGIGFDLNQLKRGNGLSNMERRANEIKYNFEIVTSINAGTTIKLSKL
jgi:ligand-binding sensor domain-containing protein/signal transduction histidine kinase